MRAGLLVWIKPSLIVRSGLVPHPPGRIGAYRRGRVPKVTMLSLPSAATADTPTK